jgi:hypothetical protein
MLNPVVYIGIVCILIVLTGAGLGMIQSPVLLWWWFNVFIAVYELYIVKKRHTLLAKDCPKDFWAEAVGPGFWKRAWLEYTCQSDRRYLDPNDAVYLIEFGNVIWVILLGVALAAGNPMGIAVVLLGQAYHCGVYFVSLIHSGNIHWARPEKTIGYLGISALWIIIPLLCVKWIFKGATLSSSSSH